MGNCTTSRRSTDSLNMQSKEHQQQRGKAAVGLRKCKSDHPNDGSISSPLSDDGEASLKLSRSNGTIPCRIPILKDSGGNTSPSLVVVKGSYKSVLVDRPTSSRIPVTSTIVECRKSLDPGDGCGAGGGAGAGNKDGDNDNSQFHESGFASDLSVTASTYSQVNTESKSTDSRDHDFDPISSINKLPNKPTYLNIRHRQQDNTTNIVNARASTIGPFTPDTVARQSSTMSIKSISTYNVDNTLRRPQSISTETEVSLLHKSLSKRRSEGSDVILSPVSGSMHEHSAVMQDVSSLKLMLHKLKRYLTQDGDNNIDCGNDSVFRLYSPLSSTGTSNNTNIKSLTREELEQKYETLLDQNVNLERLLQSREKVIARLQANRVETHEYRTVHTGLGDTADLGEAQYRWGNLKVPQSHG